MIRNHRLAVIAAGKMGEAIIAGMVRFGMAPDRITASNRRQQRLDELHERYGVSTTTVNADAARGADVVVVACKPQTFDRIAADIRDAVAPEALVVSVMAGVSASRLCWALAHDRVVRAMPNLPATIGEGMTVWYATPDTADEQHALASQLLQSLGDEEQVAEENYLDMATALSGTGPAYLFLLLEGLIDAGVHMGFARHLAERLVKKTLQGAVDYALRSGDHPVQLRNAVTSPGGTTAAAMYELEKGGLRTVLADGVWAAYRRSQALGDVHKPGEETPGTRSRSTSSRRTRRVTDDDEN